MFSNVFSFFSRNSTKHSAKREREIVNFKKNFAVWNNIKELMKHWRCFSYNVTNYTSNEMESEVWVESKSLRQTPKNLSCNFYSCYLKKPSLFHRHRRVFYSTTVYICVFFRFINYLKENFSVHVLFSSLVGVRKIEGKI